MDTYFKFKMFYEYIIPIALFLVALLIVIVVSAISSMKEKRVNKFFISNGYKRELFDVASFGDVDFYGWVREYDNIRVDDRDIKGLSLRQIKKKYK